MAKVRWGILGCSDFARRRGIPAMLQAPSVDLVGVASRGRAKAAAFRDQFQLRRCYAGYDELLDDPEIDAVYIPLPNALHGEWTRKALLNSKHVLCEKPFALSEAEAVGLAELARRTRRVVMENFLWRHHPQHERARQAIADGAIGKIRLVRAAFSYTLAQRPNIRLDEKLGGGALFDIGCYPISSARHYFGGEPCEVVASGDLDEGYKVDMSIAAIMRFAGGMALFDSSFSLPYRTELELVGDKGRILFPKPWQPPEQATIIINEESIALPPANQFVTLLEHFCRCVSEGAEPQYGTEDSVHQARALEAVAQAVGVATGLAPTSRR